MSQFKDIRWKETVQINLLRAIVMGIVWSIIVIVLSISDASPGGLSIGGAILGFGIGMPLVYLLFFVPLGLIASGLSRIGIPWVGTVTFIPTLLAIPADPIMYAIWKIKPALVPIDSYKFIFFAICIVIYDN